MAIAVAVITGGCTLIGGVLSKRTSSISDDQNNLNNSFRLFMEAQDQKYDDLQKEHVECNTKLTTLRSVVMKLVRALREKGIPLPLFSFQEQMLILEDKSFEENGDMNGRLPATPHAPPAE